MCKTCNYPLITPTSVQLHFLAQSTIFTGLYWYFQLRRFIYSNNSAGHLRLTFQQRIKVSHFYVGLPSY